MLATYKVSPDWEARTEVAFENDEHCIKHTVFFKGNRLMTYKLTSEYLEVLRFGEFEGKTVIGLRADIFPSVTCGKPAGVFNSDDFVQFLCDIYADESENEHIGGFAITVDNIFVNALQSVFMNDESITEAIEEAKKK